MSYNHRQCKHCKWSKYMSDRMSFGQWICMNKEVGSCNARTCSKYEERHIRGGNYLKGTAIR